MIIQKGKSFLSVFMVFFLLLSGCGSNEYFLSDENRFPLEDTVYGENDGRAKVYRAPGQSVPEVVQTISSKRSPEETSKRDEERMFLVYRNQLIHVMRDAEQPEDTLIEVSSQQFVKNNYDMSFLEVYLVASIARDLYNIGGSAGRYRDPYGGYVGPSGRYAKSRGNSGSIRYGSEGGGSSRGGGIGFGK